MFSPHIWAGFTSAFLFGLAFMIFSLGQVAAMVARIRRIQDRELYLLRKYLDRTTSEEALALAESVADTLNQNPTTEPNFEYGVDIAIDRDDRLWLIEANGQPQGFWAQHDRAVFVIAYLLSLTA